MSFLQPVIRPVLSPVLRSPFDVVGSSLSAQVAAMFSGGAKGLMWKPSDLSTLSQTSTGTLGNVAATNPVGYIGDKSGRGHPGLQATDANRGTLSVSGSVTSITLDGVNDGYSLTAYAAGNFAADMDFFCAIKRTTADQGMLIRNGVTNDWFGLWQSANATVSAAGCGTPTHWVNGSAVPGGTATTRAQLDTAMTVGSWVILEIRNLDLSLWTNFLFGNGFIGYEVDAGFGGAVLCPAQSTANRTLIRNYLANEVGVFF